MKTNGNCRKILVTVAGNALIHRGPPLESEQTDTIFFASAGHENRGDTNRTAHETNSR